MFSFWGKFHRRQLWGPIFRWRSQIDDLGRLPGPPRAQPLTLSADQRECERVWGQDDRTPPQGSISRDTPQQLMPARQVPDSVFSFPPRGGPIFRKFAQKRAKTGSPAGTQNAKSWRLNDRRAGSDGALERYAR